AQARGHSRRAVRGKDAFSGFGPLSGGDSRSYRSPCDEQCIGRMERDDSRWMGCQQFREYDGWWRHDFGDLKQWYVRPNAARSDKHRVGREFESWLFRLSPVSDAIACKLQ